MTLNYFLSTFYSPISPSSLNLIQFSEATFPTDLLRNRRLWETATVNETTNSHLLFWERLNLFIFCVMVIFVLSRVHSFICKCDNVHVSISLFVNVFRWREQFSPQLYLVIEIKIILLRGCSWPLRNNNSENVFNFCESRTKDLFFIEVEQVIIINGGPTTNWARMWNKAKSWLSVLEVFSENLRQRQFQKRQNWAV